MAANFWTSSHCAHWLRDRSSVNRSNAKDLELFQNRNDIWLLRRYFIDFIEQFGQRLGLRQRVISTAQVFFKRFYLNHSFVSFDPRLAAPTMLFVAAKVEECALNAKTILIKLNRMDAPPAQASGSNQGLPMPPPALINQSAPAYIATVAAATAATATSLEATAATPVTPLPFLYEMEDLLEMEFAVLVGIKYDLIVFHPYRPLMQYLEEMKLPECLQMSWEIVNDSYRTDLPLLHPPYLIALAAIYITCNYQDKEYRTWFKTLNVDQEKIMEIARELQALWDDAENYASTANFARLQTLLNKLNTPQFKSLGQIDRELKAAAAAAAAAAQSSPTPLASPTSASPAASSAAPAAAAAAASGAKRNISETPPQDPRLQPAPPPQQKAAELEPDAKRRRAPVN